MAQRLSAPFFMEVFGGIWSSSQPRLSNQRLQPAALGAMLKRRGRNAVVASQARQLLRHHVTQGVSTLLPATL
jgi:hypothetical protein